MKIPSHYLKEFSKECDDIIDTVDSIAINYTSALDMCIDEVKDLIKNKDDLTIDQINFYIIQIPILLYELHDKIQNLGVKGDAAKMQRKNQYNKAYQEQEHGTVAQKTSIAQDACQDEQMIEDIFSRVYKKCENKIEMATMLHGSLKKILQWRVSELEVTRTNTFSNNILGGL
jgi:hypothetical protein